MIQIIHLSDFHLNEKNLNDWNSYVKKAFVKQIKILNLDMSKTIIVCTGDMVDKGNIHYKTQNAFDVFKVEVIDYICKYLSVGTDRFLIVSGNHDIVRSNDTEVTELGLRALYNQGFAKILSSVKRILDNEDREGVKRNIPFSDFESKLYNGVDRYSSFLGSAFRYNIDNSNIGIACLNSSWRCYDDNDKDFLVLGEEQLNRCTNYIKDCEIKIALMHHPLDWFKLEQNIISKHISKDYNMLFVGHVHEASTITQTGFSGTLLTNIAPSCTSDIRDDSKAFSNGFTFVQYDKTNKEVICKYFKYNHKNKEFALNSEIGERGQIVFEIPNPNKTSTHALVEKCIKNIQEDFYKIMDEHIIAQKIHVIPNIKEAFIMPPLTEQNKEEYLSLDEICKSKQNICIFGTQEIGKTTLLYRITREFIDKYSHSRKIPVYIDVKEMGNKEITTCIKDFLRCSTEDAHTLISEKLIVLLIDNLDYTALNKDRINKINTFDSANHEIQIIATTDNILDNVPTESHIKNSVIPFRNLYLGQLKSSHIKELMVKWLPQDDNAKREEKLEKIVNNFCSYSLPCTAMSVSLFLWSTENSNKKPINQAVLLDIYIEIVLEKLAKENIYRDSFDYKNKTMLLAKIAQEMLKSKESSYAISYSQYIKIITDYIQTVGFDYDSSRIAEYFIERKIFSKMANNVKFSHSCFFHFFIAKRMEYDIDFKNAILSEPSFHMFPRELDYYTGLTRNDKSTLILIFGRFKKAFDGIEEIFNQVDVDKNFTYILKNQTSHEPITKSIDTNKIKSNRPSEEKILEFYDTKLSKSTHDAIIRKVDNFNLEILITIMSNILRNSEGVEDLNLKKEIYNSIIRNTVGWTVLYKEWIVRYVQKHNALPPFIAQESNLVSFLQLLPMNIQNGVNNHLGTYKLTPVMASKIEKDNHDKTCSDVEKYFSVGLYWDSQGKDKFKPFKELIKTLSNNIVQDYCMYKLYDYFYRKTKPDSPEAEQCIELLTRLKLKTEKLHKRLTGSIMLEFKGRKKKI
ncbi:MAG: metallophosphoesterase [Prevotellaceae bacterium]|jgi:DNA repair exonuclease SbcCD nuclease subunit|nr:metallophosphoesterase [Prevotellaceae bacterium]